MSPVTRLREEILQMTEFFETVLPGTLAKHNITLDVSPKFGDLRDREFIRYPIDVRYGVGDHWELFGGLTPLSPNPFNGGEEHRWGLGQIKLGARRDVQWLRGTFDKVTIGLETRAPLGQPPVSLFDHYTHIRPFVSAARPLPWPHTTFFANASYDRALITPGRDDPPAGLLRRHILELTPGVLYKPGEFGGFVEYIFRHFDETEGGRLGHGGKIGLIWDAPLQRTQGWGLPGKWQFEIAYKLEKEEGRSLDHGLAARVRWKTTLREVRASMPIDYVGRILLPRRPNGGNGHPASPAAP